MVRKSSTHGRRKPSGSTVSSRASLSHVMESESEQQEETAAKSLTEAEIDALGAARDARFDEAERELRSVLDSDDVSDHVRKRQLTRLFDRFRFEYTQLSLQFRENLRVQSKLMDKCLEMKNELVMSAIRFKTAKQLQEEEIKNLVFYRDECEHAWRAMSVSEERERDAMRIIDDLKSEIDGLQDQVKTLLSIETAPPHHHHASSKVKFAKTTTTPASLAEDPPSLSPVRSPLRKFLSSPSPSPSPVSSPSKGSAAAPSSPPPLLSFDEWKISTRVWSPPTTGATQKAPTPTQDELFTQQHKLEMARCVSVPALQPTAMERATTAVASGSLSPSRRHQLLEPRRATTSVHSERPQQPVLPSVSTRRV